MEITDKELLAICNLSNLRMEFADLNKNKAERSEDEKDEKVLSNHTIYSLLEKEIESIKNDPSTRAFRKEKYKNGIIDHSFNI